MQIRPEIFDDRAAIYAVTHEAFAGQDPMVEPEEVSLLQNLFTCRGYDPAYSFVAEHEGVVIGHVIATWGSIRGAELLGLGPIAVAKEYQDRGVGSLLMQTMHDAAQRDGRAGILLLGDPGFYARFGYEPAAAHGITPSQPEWGEHFMVKVFDAQALPRGSYRYAEPFGC